MLTSWLWIDTRRTFICGLLIMIAISVFGALGYDPEGRESFEGYVPEVVRGASNVYILLVALLSRCGITCRKGACREHLQGLPMSGRQWIRAQFLVVAVLAAFVALVYHLLFVGITYQFYGQVHGGSTVAGVCLAQVGRWVIGSWMVFGAMVAIDASGDFWRELVKTYVFLWVLGVIVLGLGLYGPWAIFEWPPPESLLFPFHWDGTIGLPLLLSWFFARQAVKSVDAGLDR